MAHESDEALEQQEREQREDNELARRMGSNDGQMRQGFVNYLRAFMRANDGGASRAQHINDLNQIV